MSHHPRGAGGPYSVAAHLGRGVLPAFRVSHAAVFGGGPWQYLLLVRDEMTVSHKHLGEFCSSLKQYLKSVAGERDCFQWVPPAAVHGGPGGSGRSWEGTGCPAALTERGNH